MLPSLLFIFEYIVINLEYAIARLFSRLAIAYSKVIKDLI